MKDLRCVFGYHAMKRVKELYALYRKEGKEEEIERDLFPAMTMDQCSRCGHTVHNFRNKFDDAMFWHSIVTESDVERVVERMLKRKRFAGYEEVELTNEEE